MSDILIDGELIRSFPKDFDTIFRIRPNRAQIFGEIFKESGVDKLHPELKRAFLQDMVINKVLWQEMYQLGGADLLTEDQHTYDLIEIEPGSL